MNVKKRVSKRNEYCQGSHDYYTISDAEDEFNRDGLTGREDEPDLGKLHAVTCNG